MSFPTAFVPEGMSYVNAYHALWLKAEPVGIMLAKPTF